MIIVDLHNEQDVQRRLRQMRITPQKQRRVLTRVARVALKDNKARVIAQSTVSGSAFQARSPKTPPKRMRKKMLVKLGRQLTFKNVTDDNVLMGWKKGKGKVAKVAAEHQYGKTKTRTLTKSKKRGDIKVERATQRQARELLANGYKYRRGNGKGYATPTLKWIKTNLSISQAGAILKALRGAVNKSVTTVLPARPAFGFADVDYQKYLKTAVKAITDVQLEP